MGFRANGGFDFTKELKEMLRKMMGFGANGGFALQRKRENSYKKRRGLEPTVDLDVQRKERLIVKNYKKKKGVGLNGGFDFI